MKKLGTRLLLAALAVHCLAHVLHAGDYDFDAARAKLRSSRAQGTVAAGTTPATGSAPQGTRYSSRNSAEGFRLTAQYRGIVKKRSNDLGGGNLRCWQEASDGPDEFRVRLNANAVTPDGKDRIDFDVYRHFRLAGNHVQIIDEKNTFNPYAAKYQNKILNTVSLAYLIKFRCPSDAGVGARPLSYIIDNRTYTLSCAFNNHKGRQITEVTLWDSEGADHVGKFFLQPLVNGVHPFDYFRIYTRDKVVVEFKII